MDILNTPPNELPYPFYVFTDPSQLQDMDLSFAYHVVIKDDKAKTMCNDIACSNCPFASTSSGEIAAIRCKSLMITYTKTYFPEVLI